MGRRSSVSKLPAELRQLVSQRRRDGKTIVEIRSELLERGASISKSALARYTQPLDADAPDMRRRGLRDDLRAIREGVEAIAEHLAARR